MCGELETDESRAEEFYARFVDHTRSFLAGLTAESAAGEGDTLYAHLDALFRNTLAAAAEYDRESKEVSAYERLCMEPLVYARLAGFMAAHQPLADDPLRRLIEAVMTGYAEGEAVMSDRDHHHSHGHDHTH
ncbi:MAG: hypothetical protein ACE10G_12655 [Gemmatimonadales bacterium]